MNKIALGLGSNLGNRLLNLRAAVKYLEKSGLTLLKKSDVFETPPWGVLDQPHFLNACLLCEGAIEPEALLDLVKEIERRTGRTETRRWGERVIDIDILLIEGRVYRSARLAIPHKEMENRCFVLVPLAQLVPEWIHPGSGHSVAKMASECSFLTQIGAL